MVPSQEEVIKDTHNIAYGKAVGFDEIPAEVWKLEYFKEFLLEYIARWIDGFILPFPMKETYSSITITFIT